jgi:hypothetical protein
MDQQEEVTDLQTKEAMNQVKKWYLKTITTTVIIVDL